MGHKSLEAFPIWGPQPRLSWLKTWASPRYNHVNTCKSCNLWA